VSHYAGKPLSPRERAVLEGIAAGMPRAEIAEDLGISQETVKFHTVRVYEKLEARNAPHAVALAYHRGILLVPRREDPR
jgi:DNA-binding CsgD family transcriptional regulator